MVFFNPSFITRVAEELEAGLFVQLDDTWTMDCNKEDVEDSRRKPGGTHPWGCGTRCSNKRVGATVQLIWCVYIYIFQNFQGFGFMSSGWEWDF